MLLVALGPLGLGLIGCQALNPQEDEAPFRFETQETPTLALTIVDEQNMPVMGASVVVRDAEGGGVLFRGISDPHGRLNGSWTAAPHQTVDVIIQKSGLQGPYSDETLRQQHGPFAPTAWVRREAASLRPTTLQLREVAR